MVVFYHRIQVLCAYIRGMRKTIYSPGQRVFIRLLRETREAAGLHQADLAMRLGTAQSVVSKIETGDRQMDLLELRQWCIALELDLEDFVRRLERALRDEETAGS